MARTITKQQALDMLRQIGSGNLVADAAQNLPDSIDLDRDGNLLLRYGLTLDHLIDRFGGSP
ncbi:hypothetical protein [Mycobacterium sp.]|uniref:hypothetical protein n=1 Tax=Mycobacterium sp. TaxID=1785 RepID=UPI003D0F6823